MNEKERTGGSVPARPPKVETCRPKNWLVPVVLLALRDQSSYGYELMERAAEFGFEVTNAGTLYRTLRQMEKEGMVESRWETSKEGPARRVYSTTKVGNAYLDLWVDALSKYRRAIDAFFGLYNREPQGSRST